MMPTAMPAMPLATGQTVKLPYGQALKDQVLKAYELVQHNPYHFFPQWFHATDLTALMAQPVLFLGQDNAYGQVVNNIATLPDLNVLGTVLFDPTTATHTPPNHPLITEAEFLTLAQMQQAKGQPLWVINFHMGSNAYQYWQRLCLQHNIRLLDWAEALRLPMFASVQSGQVTDLWTGLKDRIPECLSRAELFADPHSREVLYRLLLYRLTLDRRALWPIQSGWKSEYLFPGLYEVTPADHFADVGAFNGDTLGQFSLATQGQFDHYTGFEPDPGTYEVLTQYVANRPALANRVTLVPAGVSDTAGTLSFFQGWGGGSRLRNPQETITGNITEVPCIRLDDYFANKRPPTLIKLDVEGAELAGLRGAQQLIETHKPNLAVCAYHLPTDLLDITQWVAELSAGYTLRLRHHSDSHWDTVLYASVL
jgi:FkbM family methyltransferase